MDRDAKGRFLKGHKLSGPGRPNAKTEEEYLRILRHAVKPADWEHIIYTAIAFAKANDARAREWLSDYLLGKPAQEVKLQAVGDLKIQLKWSDTEIESENVERRS